MANRVKIINDIMDILPKAHPGISTGEKLSFERSLYPFTNQILKDIVLKRLTYLMNNPLEKR